jgi:hypothetical protein
MDFQPSRHSLFKLLVLILTTMRYKTLIYAPAAKTQGIILEKE